ncbi:MAG: MFS transporter [Corynebacterium glucuronolyticum]|nr:MFS transporter [Corynebacterium glucuronolyticum]
MPNPHEVVTRRALAVWMSAVIVYIIAITGRTSFGVAGVEALDRFQVDASHIAVFTAVQVGTYALSQIPAGLLIDKFGPRKLLVYGALIMAFGQLLLGFTTVYGVAIFARILIGMGDATAFLSVMRILPYWIPLHKSPMFTQLTSSLGQLGQFLSAIPFLTLLHWTGWTPAFVTLGAGGVLVALAARVAVADSPEADAAMEEMRHARREKEEQVKELRHQRAEAAKRERAGLPPAKKATVVAHQVAERADGQRRAVLRGARKFFLPLVALTRLQEDEKRGRHGHDTIAAIKAVAKNPIVWLAFLIHATCMTPVITFTLLWGLPMMTQGMGLSPTVAGLVLTVNTIVSFAIGPFHGFVSSRLGRRRDIAAFVFALGLGLTWVIFFWTDKPRGLVAVIVALVCMSVLTPAANYGFDFVREELPHNVVATGTGFANMGGFIFGMIASQGMGILLDISADSTTYSWADFQFGWRAVTATWFAGLVFIALLRTGIFLASRHSPAEPRRVRIVDTSEDD